MKWDFFYCSLYLFLFTILATPNKFFFINMVTFFQEYKCMNFRWNFRCFQNKNQLKKLLRQLNIMIHRLEQDGYLGGSESVQVVFLYCLYLHHIELPFNIKRGLESHLLVRSLWSWSQSSWNYNYLCNQCLSPLKLRGQTLFMMRCTWCTKNH
jgi:hypothetical protein